MTSNIRVGTGFDIHRLVLERRLILGGIHVPFNLGLEGHSDGDALIHAIIDALLGAAALGDIGIFFPPDNAQFANADSSNMLAQVRNWLTERKYAIINIDTVLICERPKLASYYPKMQARLSEILGIETNRISVKAKTAEGLGDIGRGDAIAAQACALLELL